MKNDDDINFLRHLETGYSDTYQLLVECRELLNELGFFDLQERGLPLSSFDFNFDTSDEIVQVAASIEDGFLMIPPYYSDYDQEKIKRLFNLRVLLVGRIYSIVNGVKHNIPLNGQCNYCPKIEFFNNTTS